MPLSTAQATRTLANAHFSTLVQSLVTHLKQKRLLVFTITAFLTGYTLAAYLLVSRGLQFVNSVPLLGPILTDRLVFVLFFFFFSTSVLPLRISWLMVGIRPNYPLEPSRSLVLTPQNRTARQAAPWRAARKRAGA